MENEKKWEDYTVEELEEHDDWEEVWCPDCYSEDTDLNPFGNETYVCNECGCKFN